MAKRIFSVLAAAFLLFGLAAPSFAASTSVDALIEKLIDKGVLTKEEGRQLKTEIIEDEKMMRDESIKQGLPDWVKNIKLKGDMRLRFQSKHDKAANDYSKDTNIGRVRLRLGLEGKVNEKLLAGIGIATGSGDPRSTNITFGSYNTKKSIVLDYVYAKYNALPWLKLVGGKMLLGDAFWEPTDLIWDTDITPEGAMLQFNKKLDSGAELFMNTGALIVDADTSTDADAPMAYMVQPGVKYKVNENISATGAFSYQGFSNIKGKTSSSYSGASNAGNTTAGSSAYKYDYNMINPAVELSIKEPFKAIGLNVEKMNVFGEYVENLAVSDDASGFSCGLQIGHNKISKMGDWQLKYIYAMLDREAVLDVLPDSDRYSGKTGIRSHEVSFGYGLGKNTFLGLDVYRSWRTYGSEAPETLVQVDWNMKF